MKQTLKIEIDAIGTWSPQDLAEFVERAVHDYSKRYDALGPGPTAPDVFWVRCQPEKDEVR